MSQPIERDDQQHKADRAKFFRALADAVDDGMPMPFQVYFSSAVGRAEMRYRSIAEVDASLVFIGGEGTHDDHTYDDGHRKWHSYGNEYGQATPGRWAGFEVKVWVAADGPSPVEAVDAR